MPQSNLDLIQRAAIVAGHNNQFDFGNGFEAELFYPTSHLRRYAVLILKSGELHTFTQHTCLASALDFIATECRSA